MDDIDLVVEGAIATITLNRPAKLNAVTPAMTALIAAAVKEVESASSVRVVILSGAGDKAFCVGSDIGELDAYPTAWSFRSRPDYCDSIRLLRKPTIAAVNGYAYGGGLELCLSCDIRLAASTARFAAPEIKLGWIGGGGVTPLLCHAVGSSNAALMVMTGDPIDASRALAWGMVSEVTEPEALRARAAQLAETIATRAPIAAETAKLNLRAAKSMSIEAAVQYERDLQTICFATEDAAEGRLAFKEKRPAHFQGR